MTSAIERRSGTDTWSAWLKARARGSPRPVLAAMSIALMVTALVACGGPGHITPVGVAPNTILIDNFSFAPGGVVVAPGSKIMVVNHGVTTHTVTAVDKSFDSGPVPPGRSVAIIAPRAPGKYHYVCMFHEYMTGFVTVTASASASASQATPTPDG